VTFRSGQPDADGPLTSLFALVDGQVDGPAVFDGGFTLSCVEDARRDKDMLDTMARDEQWPSSWWSPTWFPFASDGCGQMLVVDGDSGAVIEFIHDDDERPVRAPSLAAFFDDAADSLERGALVFDPHIGVVGADAAERWQEERDARAAEAAVSAARARWWPLVGIGVAVVLALVVGLVQ
jgi:hypothetical protein